MIIALAGRRIDTTDAAPKRFPLENVAAVREKIRSALQDAKATGLVCAAACGADLLALEVAGEIGIRRRIVLPYDQAAFKQSSVTDRPGDWGAAYDRILAEVDAKGDLSVYDYASGDPDIYFAVNHDILDAAEELAESTRQELAVLVVWDQDSRGENDVTAHFLEEARQRGLRVGEVPTL